MNVCYAHFIFHPSALILFKNFAVEIHQFHRCSRGFKTLVTQLYPRPVNGLVERVCGHDSENHRYSCFHSSLPDASRYFACDVIEVWSLPADDCSQTNHRVEFVRLGDFKSEQRNLERSGNAKDLDGLFAGAKTFQRVESAFDQTSADEVIPATGDNRETKSIGIQFTFVSGW